MKCVVCGTTVPPALRNCPGCSTDVGFPNVRLAANDDEKQALEKRLGNAEASTNARNCRKVLEDFGREVLRSKVVIARNLTVVQNLVESENQLYVSFYKQLASGSRIPEDNAWDRGRVAADSAVSPYFYQELEYGALSLDGRGVSHFGAYSIVLREGMIAQRATVFEENPFLFCQKRKIATGQPIPPGFRAVWTERDKLAKAKLHSQLTPATAPTEFPRVLLNDGGSDANFVEAHIFGPIHRVAIERVIGPRPRGGSQLAIWKSVSISLKKIGASMDVI